MRAALSLVRKQTIAVNTPREEVKSFQTSKNLTWKICFRYIILKKWKQRGIWFNLTSISTFQSMISKLVSYSLTTENDSEQWSSIKRLPRSNQLQTYSSDKLWRSNSNILHRLLSIFAGAFLEKFSCASVSIKFPETFTARWRAFTLSFAIQKNWFPASIFLCKMQIMLPLYGREF